MTTPSPERNHGIEGLVRPHLRQLEPYQAIVPYEVLSQRLGIPEERLIKLDGNENPYGCSPRAREALASFRNYHIYPDPGSEALRDALQSYVGMGKEHIVAGAGSDELIDLAMRLLLEPGDKVVNLVPTFGMYRFNTQVCGGEIVEIPRRPDYSVNVAWVKRAVDARTKVIFVASPNNPTGNLLPKDDLMELLDLGPAVVVDEAYAEFAGETFVPEVKQYDKLFVLRTFSKWAGLAGLRVGYGVFPPTIADLLLRMKPPYNINVAAQVAAVESLADLDYLRTNILLIIEERERLRIGLERTGFLKPFPSHGNFILCAVQGMDAKLLRDKLEARGILVRYFNTPLLKNMVRISVGKPEHTQALLDSLERIRKEAGV